MRKSDSILVQAFLEAGLPTMAKLAGTGYYNDYFSPLEMPSTQLMADLHELFARVMSPNQKGRIQSMIARHLNGEFDATREESDEWAASSEGQETFAELMKSVKNQSKTSSH